MNDYSNISSDGVNFLKRWWFYIAFVLLLSILLMQQFCWNPPMHIAGGAYTEADVSAKAHPVPPAPAQKPISKPKVAAPAPAKPQEVPLSIGSVADNVFAPRKPLTDFPKPSPDLVKTFVEQYRKIAVQESKKYAIPVAIILATAVRQSFAGKRDVALSANNLFGLTCTGNWTGKSVLSSGRCYRAYESSWASFRDFSLFLKQPAFASLFKFNKTDFAAWAQGLEKAGYPEMNAQDLLEIIQDYKITSE